MTDSPMAKPALHRRHRFLDHLLVRRAARLRPLDVDVREALLDDEPSWSSRVAPTKSRFSFASIETENFAPPTTEQYSSHRHHARVSGTGASHGDSKSIVCPNLTRASLNVELHHANVRSMFTHWFTTRLSTCARTR